MMEGQTAVFAEDTDPLLGPHLYTQSPPGGQISQHHCSADPFHPADLGNGFIPMFVRCWFICLYHLAVVTGIEYASHRRGSPFLTGPRQGSSSLVTDAYFLSHSFLCLHTAKQNQKPVVQEAVPGVTESPVQSGRTVVLFKTTEGFLLGKAPSACNHRSGRAELSLLRGFRGLPAFFFQQRQQQMPTPRADSNRAGVLFCVLSLCDSSGARIISKPLVSQSVRISFLFHHSSQVPGSDNPVLGAFHHKSLVNNQENGL